MAHLAPGMDSNGKSYTSSEAMWAAELAKQDAATGEKAWYANAIEYWASIPASVDGVLGGYGRVSPADVRDSDAFLRDVWPAAVAAAARGERRLVAADCGAGMGRVSEQFLLRHCGEVHLVEPVKHFLDAARAKMGDELPAAPAACAEAPGGPPPPPPAPGPRSLRYLCEPLQKWAPAAGAYDLIWAQWVLGHLTDSDFVAFFERCGAGLAPGGLIVVKENNTSGEEGFIVDKDDSSVTRSDAYLRELFARAGLELLAPPRAQRAFPKELFTVRMYALRPRGAPERA